MNRAAFVVVLTCLAGCAEPPPPPPVTLERVRPPPPPPPVDAGQPERAPAPATPDDEPVLVSQFPEAKAPSDDLTDEALIELLLIDPREAEAKLVAADAPEAFRLAIISELARARSGDALRLDDEPLLPLPGLERPGPVDAGAAWTVEDGVEVMKGRAVQVRLPFNARVEVRSMTGTSAQVEVRIARAAVYGAKERFPQSVVEDVVRGTVQVSQLSGEPLDRRGLETLAKELSSSSAEAPDAGSGSLAAIAAWQRLLRFDHGGTAREGLLRAGFKARRAATVAAAALSRDVVTSRSMTALWGCLDAPPARTLITLGQKLPGALTAGQCLTAVDERKSCDEDPPAQKKRREAERAFLAAQNLGAESWLRFSVDARTPRRLLLISTPLTSADPCSDFEEVKLDAGAGRVRRLVLPQGGANLDVWVSVPRGLGVEHALVAASELNAVEWLRSRERYRWTVSKRGELQPSLGVDAAEFALERDVEAVSWAAAPERNCRCADDAPPER